MKYSSTQNTDLQQSTTLKFFKEKLKAYLFTIDDVTYLCYIEGKELIIWYLKKKNRLQDEFLKFSQILCIIREIRSSWKIHQ